MIQDRCEASVQERTGWGFTYQCNYRAKRAAQTYDGRTIRVCGTHARVDGSLIKFRHRMTESEARLMDGTVR